MHKKFIALALAAIVLAGCDTTWQTVGLSAAAGAAGATLVGGSAATGALLVGGAALACEEGLICNN